MARAFEHRFLVGNKSTPEMWYDGQHKKYIPVNSLSWNHLAAIVDQYESEMVKLYTEIFKPPPIGVDAAKNIHIQKYLRKNVLAWRAIKERQRYIQMSCPAAYRDLFVNKKYESKKTPNPTQTQTIKDADYTAKKLKFAEFMGAPVLPSGIYVNTNELTRYKRLISLKLNHIDILKKQIEEILKKF